MLLSGSPQVTSVLHPSTLFLPMPCHPGRCEEAGCSAPALSTVDSGLPLAMLSTGEMVVCASVAQLPQCLCASGPPAHGLPPGKDWACHPERAPVFMAAADPSEKYWFLPGVLEEGPLVVLQLSQTTAHRPQTTDHRSQNTERRSQNTDHRTETTEHRNHRTENRDDRPQNTEQRLQTTEYRPQITDS